MKLENQKKTVILMVDDDEDYYQLFKHVLMLEGQTCELKYVEDGELCMDYLLRRGDYTSPEKSPRPGIILMDMNMPKKNGFEALQEIKMISELRTIPILMFTISRTAEHITRSYDLGAGAFITKPLNLEQLTKTVKTLCHYWGEVVSLP